MKNTNVLGLKSIAFILVLILSFASLAGLVSAQGEMAKQEEVTEEAVELTYSADERNLEADDVSEADASSEHPNLYFIQSNKQDEIILAGFVDNSLAPDFLIIPSMVNGKKVAAIADYAFENLGFLTYVKIPASVKSIGAQAFSGCSALSRVDFDDELDFIGSDAFGKTAWFNAQPLDFVYAGKMNKHLVGYKGAGKDIIIPHTTEKIAPYVFANNDNIESVTIPERVTYIGEGAFFNCSNLSEVTMRGAIEYCGENAFEGSEWMNSHSGEYVFFGDLLVKYTGNEENLIIPNSFTKIADKAFEGSDFILSLQIPSTVEIIGKDAFPKKAEIYCYKNTYAHSYALENGYEIRAFLHIKGDFNGDGKVTAADARAYLRVSAKLENVYESDFHLFNAGDMDGDGTITASDARTILRISARLESFDVNDLIVKPGTTFDVLMGYSQALRYAAIREAGFSLLEHQKIEEYNLNANSVLYLREFSAGLTSEKKAKVEKIAPDDADRLGSLYLSSLLNSGVVKDAKCDIKDGKYIYEIKLQDEVAEFGKESFTSMIFPVAAKEDFQKLLESRWWYNLYASDGRLTYDITYTNCSLKAVVDISTGRVESVDMNMEYKITDIAGKLGGITIKDGSGKTNGNAIRVDTVKYDDFIFTLPS